MFQGRKATRQPRGPVRIDTMGGSAPILLEVVGASTPHFLKILMVEIEIFRYLYSGLV